MVMTVRYYRIVIQALAGSLGVPPTQKTPEMDELESNKKSWKSELTISKNKKVRAFSDFGIFFVTKSTFRGKKRNMVADNREL